MENKKLFDNINGYSLDHNQRMAVVTDEINNLVIAGAGSGKTLTVVAKYLYLIKRKKLSPENILLLSFTKKAAGEMEERISQSVSEPIDSNTFHKFGKKIITDADKNCPSIYDQGILVYLKKYFKENTGNNSELNQMLLEFISLYIYQSEDPENYETYGEYVEEFQSKDLETMKNKILGLKNSNNTRGTLNGEYVKSIEELIIANFLFMNGVEYLYEEPYEIKTSNRIHGQFTNQIFISRNIKYTSNTSGSPKIIDYHGCQG